MLLFRNAELLYVARANSIASFITGAIRIHYTGNYKYDSPGRTRIALAEYIDARYFATGGSRRRAQLRVEEWLNGCELAWVRCGTKTAKLTVKSLAAVPPPVNRITARLKAEKYEAPRIRILGREMTEDDATNRLYLAGMIATTLWFATVHYLFIVTSDTPTWQPTIATLLMQLILGGILGFCLFGALIGGLLEEVWTTFHQRAIATAIGAFFTPLLLLLPLL